MDLESLFIFCWLLYGAWAVRDVPSRQLSGVGKALRFVQTARAIGSLGEPRFKTIDNQLFVVGYGQCRPVESKTEGYRLLAQLKLEMEDMLSSVKPLDDIQGTLGNGDMLLGC